MKQYELASQSAYIKYICKIAGEPDTTKEYRRVNNSTISYAYSIVLGVLILVFENLNEVV